MSTSTYTVTGLTCGHCANAITEEISELPGVTQVAVDLVPNGESSVSVTADRDVPRDEIVAAVAEAGDSYTVQS